MHIDWSTLALQTVNVLVLIWILSRFFFRPVSELVAKRREEAARLIADADAARRQAEELRTEAGRLRADIDAERARLIVDARRSADAEKAQSLAQLSGELEQRRKDEMAVIARERAAMQRAVLDHAGELAVRISRRLLERLPATAAFASFLDGLRAELGRLPEDERRRLMASSPDQPLEIVAAQPLNETESRALLDVIQATLGHEVAVRIGCDRGLIAGFEVRGRNVIIRNNWQADLAAIGRELAQ